MQPAGRTPSSILRKRASQEEQNQRRRSIRAKGGRRVSFAPDDELETMHLFKTDKHSPLHSQDSQPLAELVQNHTHQPQDNVLTNLWHPVKPYAVPEQHHESVYEQNLQSPSALAQSPGLTGGLSPMSMELTNDTLQQTDGLQYPATAFDSFNLAAPHNVAACRDAAHNITDNVPALSTLVEEDEDELYNDTSTNDGSAMELTGNTGAERPSSPARLSLQHPAAAAEVSTAPKPPAESTRSTRRSSQQGTAASSPAPSMLSPRTRSRRSSDGGRTKATAKSNSDNNAAQQNLSPTPDAAVALNGRRGFAPSQEPTPSPLRRITRSMTPDKGISEALSSPGGITELLADGLNAAGGRKSRRSTLNLFADQQNKWGFVPGEEDTMMLEMNMPGAGGLGDATLHHVYSENTGTGEITRAVRQGQIGQKAPVTATVGPAATAKGGRRRSSIARQRPSLVTEVIAEEVATTAEPAAAAAEPADAMDMNMTEDMAITPDRTRGLATQQQEQETPGDAAAMGQDLDGMTTNLLLDDRSVGGWGHVLGTRIPETTGRGSVGSNVPTIHGLRLGHSTQLPSDPLDKALHQRGDHRRASAGVGPSAAAATGSAPAGYSEECTTKLLADSTAASGVMGIFGMPRAGGLLSTIAGGAPVVQPPVFAGSADAAQQQDDGFASPELQGDMVTSSKKSRGRTMLQSPAEPAVVTRTPTAQDTAIGGLSPVEPEQDQQQFQKGPCDGPFGAATAMPVFGMAALSPPVAATEQQVPEGSEPTLELAGSASQAGHTNALEDATLDEFALPPEIAGGEERPITMPFSGALSSIAANDTNPPGSVCRTPGGSIRQAQPITFTDFCQIVDMQFLTHIRRGTSISVMDFQPSTVPQDVSQALQLLSITGNEVAVLEGAMSTLQTEMHSRRREAYELEDGLGVENPPVFAAVQTARHTQLEQIKHCLVLLKKVCRAATTTSWKQLRSKMEKEMAERLAVQQRDLEEQLAFVQAKLQKAQQQREYAKSFHADVVKKLAAEEAAHQEAQAARNRLMSLRSRLAEVKQLHAERRAKADDLQSQLQTLKEQYAEVDNETSQLLVRRDQLNSILAATPKPAHNQKEGRKLRAAEGKLELVTALQGWHLTAAGPDEWLVSQSLTGIRLSLSGARANDGLVSGRLEMLPGSTPTAATTYGIGKEVLSAMVSAMRQKYDFQVPKALLSLAFSSAELALGSAVQLSEQCRELFMVQPLLTAVDVVEEAAGEVLGWLALTFIEAERQVKVKILLCLDELFAHSHAGIGNKVEVAVCGSHNTAATVQQELSSTVAAAVTASGCNSSSNSNFLERVCSEVTRYLLSLRA